VDAAVLASIISAIVTVLTVLINARATENKISTELKINQAVTDERIRTLTDEVRKHNSFAERIPVIEEQIKVASHRIDELEQRHG
jgi:hypothetical protein